VDGRIGRLRCTYRVVGPGASAASARRLDRLVRERVSASLEGELDSALAGDSAVYVLRDVRAKVAVALGAVDDELLARCVSERLAGTIVRRLASDESDGTLVRFEDEAEFVARFVGDLVDGAAWERWYYGAFASLRRGGDAGALRRVLLDHRHRLGAILGHLDRLGALDRVIGALDEATLRELWLDERSETTGADLVRPLLMAALSLVERLGLTSGAVADRDRLLDAYLRSEPEAPDWRDRRSLAAGVLHAVRFLAGEGRVRRGSDLALDEALAPLDWLDTDWLRSELTRVLGVSGNADELPARGGHALSPRRRRLLAALGLALDDARSGFDLSRPASPANAAKLLGALAARAPEWSDDPLARIVIVQLLSEFEHLRRSEYAEIARRLRRGDVDGAWRLQPAAPAPSDRAAIALLSELGPTALELADEVACQPAEQSVAPPVETQSAGTFLLLRAMLDLRLPELVRTAGYPAPFAAVVTALGPRLGGGDLADAGLALLTDARGAGMRDLRSFWLGSLPADEARLQEGLAQALIGLGVVGREPLSVERPGSTLVAGAGGVWPFGLVLGETVDAHGAIARWVGRWADATGVTLGPDAPEEGGAAAAFAAVGRGRLGLADPDLTLDLLAVALLRVWARWLPGFEGSSIPYLVSNLVRRDGLVHRGGDELVVQLERRPLDVLLELAGYTGALDARGSLGCSVSFVLTPA